MAQHTRFPLRAAVIALTAAGAAVAACAVPAAADTTSVTGSVTAGSLSESATSTAAFSVTLDGHDHTPTFAVPIDVADDTGTGAGWNITVAATQFTSGSDTLAADATSVTGVAADCASGSGCTAPANSVAYPVTVTSGAGAVKLFDAGVNSGLGEFTVTPTFSVAVPANTKAGSYTATLTFAAVSAP